jgi:GDP-4-dehydro-6-deoxy-D-mannose reductase
MKVLVTGAKGFIGSELVRNLVGIGYMVQEINSENTTGLFRALNLLNSSDIKQISSKIVEYDPDIVFHLASKTSIKQSWENPFEFIKQNIAISENLLEAIQLSGTHPLLILLSTSAVYDDSDRNISETFRLAPSSPYAISKLSIETMALRYAKTIIVRPFFTIGPNRRGDVIDEWLSQIIYSKNLGSSGVLAVGDLSLERDYLDVEESARLLIEIAEKGLVGQIYNLCSGRTHSLKQICDSLIQVTGSSSIMEIETKSPNNMKVKKRVVGDVSKLLSLGIKPNFQLEESIKRICRARVI